MLFRVIGLFQIALFVRCLYITKAHQNILKYVARGTKLYCLLLIFLSVETVLIMWFTLQDPICPLF